MVAPSLPSMPDELQLRILESCDMQTLSSICRTSKEWYDKGSPILWNDIDFVAMSGDGAYDEALIDHQRQFFAICDTLIDERPDFWAKTLAPRLRSLKLSRLPGIAISHKSKTELKAYNDFFLIEVWPRDKRTIYDIIPHFQNLHTLTLFVKDWWGGQEAHEDSLEAIARNVTKLRHLKVGGEISPNILLGLLSRPENIQHLSLINLIWSPGQDDGPDPVLFLDSIKTRFSTLKTLHLSKLAELSEDDETTGLRWQIDPAKESELLHEWADFLRHVSGTLTELTLENRYHVVNRELFDYDTVIDSKARNDVPVHGAEYGRRSSEMCWALLLPVFNELGWPNLQNLTFKGMFLSRSPAALARLSHLESRVKIEDLAGGTVMAEDETTPMNYSPPTHPRIFQD